jgi:hypothetical protein
MDTTEYPWIDKQSGIAGEQHNDNFEGEDGDE